MVGRFAGLPFDPGKYKGRDRTQPSTLPKGCPLEPGLAADELGRRVVGFYQRQVLNRDSRGWQYLASRGLADERLVNRFQLGFAPMGVGRLLRVVPDCQRVAGRQMRSELTAAGWCREVQTKRGSQEFSSSRERLVNCITVPVFDEAGAVVSATGVGREAERMAVRCIGICRVRIVACGMPMRASVQKKTVILCEAAFDALSFFVNGIENVTWSYGCSGFTADHLSHFQAFQVQTVIVAYDNDEAGNKAAHKLSAELTRHGIGVQRLLPPAGSDINQVAVTAGDDAPEALRALLRDAHWLTDAQPIIPAAVAQSTADNSVRDAEVHEKQANDAPSVVADEDFSSFSVAPAGPVLPGN